jgi:hypothetical protein
MQVLLAAAQWGQLRMGQDGPDSRSDRWAWESLLLRMHSLLQNPNRFSIFTNLFMKMAS